MKARAAGKLHRPMKASYALSSSQRSTYRTLSDAGDAPRRVAALTDPGVGASGASGSRGMRIAVNRRRLDL
jgi:hypothetical protein